MSKIKTSIVTKQKETQEMNWYLKFLKRVFFSLHLFFHIFSSYWGSRKKSNFLKEASGRSKKEEGLSYTLKYSLQKTDSLLFYVLFFYKRRGLAPRETSLSYPSINHEFKWYWKDFSRDNQSKRFKRQISVQSKTTVLFFKKSKNLFFKETHPFFLRLTSSVASVARTLRVLPFYFFTKSGSLLGGNFAYLSRNSFVPLISDQAKECFSTLWKIFSVQSKITGVQLLRCVQKNTTTSFCFSTSSFFRQAVRKKNSFPVRSKTNVVLFKKSNNSSSKASPFLKKVKVGAISDMSAFRKFFIFRFLVLAVYELKFIIFQILAVLPTYRKHRKHRKNNFFFYFVNNFISSTLLVIQFFSWKQFFFSTKNKFFFRHSNFFDSKLKAKKKLVFLLSFPCFLSVGRTARTGSTKNSGLISNFCLVPNLDVSNEKGLEEFETLVEGNSPTFSKTRTIVISSGKGGVGKTTATANLGMCIARLGYKVALIDADIGLRNLDLLLGLENRVLYTAIDILQGECRLQQALIRDKRWKNLSLLSISKNRQRYNVTRKNMANLVDSIAALGYHFILIDCPAGIDVGFINAISAANEALIVTTPEITAIRDADRVAGLLEANGIYNVKLLVNRVRPDMIRQNNMMSVRDVQEMLGIPLLGAIPEDTHVIISTNRGEPLVLKKKLTLSGLAFENATRRLIGKQDYFIDLTTPYKGVFQKVQEFFVGDT